MSTRYFLALNGVKGDLLNSTYKGWFEVSGFDFDLANSANIGSATGGAGAGKLTFSPLTLTLDSNTGLAPLLAMAATGATLNGATLVGVNDAGQQVYHLDLANVSVTNVEHHAEAFPEAGSDADPPLRSDRARDVYPERHGRRCAGGALRQRLAERGSGRECRCEPAAHETTSCSSPGLNGGSLNPAAQGLVRDHGRRPRSWEKLLGRPAELTSRP